MNVRAHFFAQLRDIVGSETVDIDLTEDGTVADLVQELYQRFPALRAHDQAILIGAGLEFVGRSYKPRAGEEIAIMPPVQGG